jgi:hypothetical protein
MKLLLSLALLLPFICLSQKVVLIDRQFQKPASYVEKIGMKNIEQGSFLIYEKDIDEVIKNVETLQTVIRSKKSVSSKMKSTIAGNTYFNVTGSGNRYNIIIDTKADKMGAFLVLASKNKSNGENLANIERFLTYLRSAKS